jgi:transposase
VACSLDLRQRVVKMIRNEGKTQDETAERFQVSVSSIKRWLKRKNLIPDKPGPTSSRQINREALLEVVKSKPDGYLDEYAEILNAKRSTVAYNLKQLGISRKKNHAIQRAKRRRTQDISAGN